LKRFVLDASVSGSWCLKDETNAAADALLESLPAVEMNVPSLWIVEMANLLVVAERRARISASDAESAMEMLTRLPVRVNATELASGKLLRALSIQNDISAYDASYLELALRLKAPLATMDRSLAAAARKSGIDLVISSI